MVPPVPSRPRHAAVGNINLDISIVLDRYPGEDTHVFARDSWIGLGGAATNYAVAAARLGHEAVLFARAGGDAVRLGLLDRLEALGVDTSRVVVAHNEPLGTVVVILVPSNGTRTMIAIRGANARLGPEHVARVSAGVYHLASVRPQLLAGLCSRDWWRRGFIASYDPGGEAYRSPEAIAETLSCVDILFVNENEMRSIARASGIEGPSGFLDLGVHVVVVKKGRGGAYVVTSESTIEAYPKRGPSPVDVTGAGDAFDAAFNAWLIETGSIEAALRAAVAAGTLKVARRGSSNMPSRIEVERFTPLVVVRPR